LFDLTFSFFIFSSAEPVGEAIRSIQIIKKITTIISINIVAASKIGEKAFVKSNT
jgi:hypothetical protein